MVGRVCDHGASSKGHAHAIAWPGMDDRGDRSVLCAAVQDGVDRPLYVDAVHYNAEPASMLTECIVERSGLADALREVPKSPD